MQITVRNKLLVLSLLPIVVVATCLTNLNSRGLASLSAATAEQLAARVVESRRAELQTATDLVFSQIEQNFFCL
jgi:signal transduction histidine kinase